MSNTNAVGSTLAHTLSLMMALNPQPNTRFTASPSNTGEVHSTQMQVFDLTKVFPGDEMKMLSTYNEEYVADRLLNAKATRIVAVKESPKLTSSFTLELWELQDDKEHQLVHRFKDVAVLAIGAWFQPLNDFMNGADLASIKFPALITQYLSNVEDSYKDARGLDFVVPGSMEKPTPALKALFDPKIDTPTNNPFSRLFRVLVRQLFVKAPQWNTLMDEFVGNTEDQFREGVRALLNTRLTSSDMSWDEFKQGVAFLKIGLGDDELGPEDVIDERVCFFDKKLHVFAKQVV